MKGNERTQIKPKIPKSVKSLKKEAGSLRTQRAQGDTTMRGEGVNRGKK